LPGCCRSFGALRRCCRRGWLIWVAAFVGQRLVGQPALIAYGVVILCFMSGVLWGFAAKGAEHQWRGYGLSVLPALWVFFMVGGGPGQALVGAAGGVSGAAGDGHAQFAGWGLVPRWWMRLRLMLTAGWWPAWRWG
jgi:hypothetical protein